MTKELPKTAKAVVIGGGIIGCSTAYHLGKLGWTDTVLLERKKLTSGTTFHAAGLVGQLRTSANITQLLGYSVDLYKRLEAETGLGTGWKMNGGLRLACNEERWTEVKRQATTAQSFGLEMHLLTPQEALRSLAADARSTTSSAPPSCRPTARPIPPISPRRWRRARAWPASRSSRIPKSSTSKSTRAGSAPSSPRKAASNARRVVVCAGQWTRAFAARFGVNVPLVSVEHQYIITESFGVPSNLPTLRDPDRLTYYKEEVGGIVMGGYEPNPIPWAADGIPEGFHYTLLDSNFDHFEQIMELALGRVPALENVGVKQLLNGPESFTPDGNFILGEAPELRNFFVGAGFNAFGIASAGGAGMALAEWVGEGRAALRSLAGRHPPLRPSAFRHRLGAHAHARGLRQALHHGLAVRGAFERPALPQVAAL